MWHLVSHLVFIDAPRVVAVTLIKQLVAEPLKTLELLCMLCMTCFLTRDSENKTSQCAVMSKQLWYSCCLLSSAEAQQRRRVHRMDSLILSTSLCGHLFCFLLSFFPYLSLPIPLMHVRTHKNANTHKHPHKHKLPQISFDLGRQKFGLFLHVCIYMTRFDSGRKPVNSNQCGSETIDPQARVLKYCFQQQKPIK